jgi:hypothetical protein
MGYIPVLLALLGFSLLVILVNVNALKKSKQGLSHTILELSEILGAEFRLSIGSKIPKPEALNEDIQQLVQAKNELDNIEEINLLVNNYKNYYLDYNTQIKGAPTKWIAPIFGYEDIS